MDNYVYKYTTNLPTCFIICRCKNIQIHANMSKLFPTNAAELTVTRQITPNITTLSSPFYRFGRVKLGGRATLGWW